MDEWSSGEESAEGQAEHDAGSARAPAAQTSAKSEVPVVDHANTEYPPFVKALHVAPGAGRAEAARLRASLGISTRGWGCPTPVQAQAIPAALSGRDVLAIARTGSGKTGAFVLPVVRHAAAQLTVPGGTSAGRWAQARHGPQVLVLAPTRELAAQTAGEVRAFAAAEGAGTRVLLATGGTDIAGSIAALRRGTDVLVATPGRATDLFRAGRGFTLRRTTLVVVDEADRMFDLGLGPQVVRLVSAARPDRQTLLFSATFPPAMDALARRLLRCRPVEVVVGVRGAVVSDVAQSVFVVSDGTRAAKAAALLAVLGERYSGGHAMDGRSALALVFVERQETADALVPELALRGYAAAALHGGMPHAERASAVSDFVSGVAPLLVATSVAARGLDVRGLGLVVNYDVPGHAEDYVHRVGRTGRAGVRGCAVTLWVPGEDDRAAPFLARALGDAGAEVPPALAEAARRASSADDGGADAPAVAGFGGRGLDNIAAERARSRRTQRLLFGCSDEDEEDEGEDLIGGDGKRKSAIDRVVEAAAALSARLGSALPDPVAEINARLGLSAASAEVAPERGAAAPDAMDGSVRAVPPDQQTPGGPRFCADLDINDYSAHARGRAISRPALAAIADVSRAAVLVRGAWAERAPRGSASRLHAHVEGPDARSVEAAVAELRRVLDEASADVSSGRV